MEETSQKQTHTSDSSIQSQSSTDMKLNDSQSTSLMEKSVISDCAQSFSRIAGNILARKEVDNSLNRFQAKYTELIQSILKQKEAERDAEKKSLEKKLMDEVAQSESLRAALSDTDARIESVKTKLSDANNLLSETWTSTNSLINTADKLETDGEKLSKKIRIHLSDCD